MAQAHVCVCVNNMTLAISFQTSACCMFFMHKLCH